MPNTNDIKDLYRLGQILEQNKEKDFVRRIGQVASGEYEWINGPGGKGRSTHSMATSEADGVHYAYPTVQRGGKGRLTRYGDDEAFERAMRMREAIPFKTAEEADWFAKNYKAFWPAKLQ